MSYGIVDKSTGRRIPIAGNGGGASVADQVEYDNTTTGLTSDNVQDAMDEAYMQFKDLGLCIVNGKVCQRVLKEV